MVQEIHFVTGKGGVGKSIVALTLAYKKAQQGQKTLLVELGDESFYKDLLDLSSVGFKPTSLRPSLDLSLWTGADCLREYARYLLKIETIYKLFFENPISRSLVNVAPALPEISIMGKITSGPRNHGPPMDYDCIVVDAYATGHFLALIKAPRSMAKTVKVGPMGQQNKEIDQVLKNSDLCKYHIVSLPEELPVRESQELYHELRAYLEVKPHFIINKMIDTTLTVTDLKKIAKKDEEVSEFASFIEAVLERQETSIEQFKKSKTEVTELPLVTEVDPWSMVEILAERMPK